jgi:hypothetical protein
MQRQQAVRGLETRLDRDLEAPYGMSSPKSARKFFHETAMRCILVRRHHE